MARRMMGHPKLQYQIGCWQNDKKAAPGGERWLAARDSFLTIGTTD